MEYETEFGCSSNIRWLPCDDVEVTLIGSDGVECEAPKCEECGSFKSAVLGISSFCWMCPFCPSKT